MLAAVRARHRELRFRVRREGASSARDVLANGERDFAIVRSPEPPADLPSRRLPSATMRRILETLRPHGGASWIEVDGNTAALRYVAAGLGIAFVSLLEGQEPTHPKVSVRNVTAHFAPVAFHLL